MRAGPPPVLNEQMEFDLKSFEIAKTSIKTLPIPELLLKGDRRTVAFFRSLRALHPQAFLFETADVTTRRSKRVVIGLRPEKTLKRRFDVESQIDVTDLIVDGCVISSHPSFFEMLSKFTSEIKARAAQHKLNTPFANGGIFGSIGYESVQEIETTVHAHSDSSSNLISAEVMLVSDLIVIEFNKNEIHAIGFAAQEALLTAIATMIKPARLQAVANEKPAELPPSRLLASMGKIQFSKKVKTLKEHLRAGDIFQAVLSEKFEIETKASAVEIFEALADLNPSAYRFFFQLSEREFAGTSPESLVRVSSDVATTHPIAGTKPRGKDASEDARNAKSLRASRKEGAEHLMLVDLARNDLGRVALPGTVQVTKYRELHRYATVMHLVSEVSARLPAGSDPIAIFRACFPAGTLTGAPKIRAMQLLSELEISRRGSYGGAVIAFDPLTNELESCIAIRCFEKAAYQVSIQAGAGIVADSKANEEYAEISHKLRALRQAIMKAENQIGLHSEKWQSQENAKSATSATSSVSLPNESSVAVHSLGAVR